MNKTIYYLLPLIFMFHEFEEILFLRIWLHKDKDYLLNKFPKIGFKIYTQYKKFTTAGFVFAIAEEFVIICILTNIAILFEKKYLWFIVFMGFSIHIIIHIIQWVLYKRYIPTIITSILVLPYCIYGFINFMNNNDIEIMWILISSITGIIAVIMNLKFVHYIGCKFSNYENRIIEN